MKTFNLRIHIPFVALTRRIEERRHKATMPGPGLFPYCSVGEETKSKMRVSSQVSSPAGKLHSINHHKNNSMSWKPGDLCLGMKENGQEALAKIVSIGNVNSGQNYASIQFQDDSSLHARWFDDLMKTTRIDNVQHDDSVSADLNKNVSSFNDVLRIENEYFGQLGCQDISVIRQSDEKNILQSGTVKETKETLIQLTTEQSKIVHHPLSSGKHDTIKIVAYPGTGKTFCLVKMCEANPDLRFLVVIYNKSMKKHAIKVFPKSNVNCSTVHSLAYNKCGYLYFRKLAKGSLKPEDILSYLTQMNSHSNYKFGSGNALANLQVLAGNVKNTLENFMNSSDRTLEEKHVPLDEKENKEILDFAKAMWAAMIDADDFSIKITHDGYLKLWQLQNPNLQDNFAHDVLLIDEGQDLNPPMLDVFNRQETTKVIVGDPHQQIYLFRGSHNALESVKSNFDYCLTQSFRFGTTISNTVNILMSKLYPSLKNDNKCKGTGSSDTILSSKNAISDTEVFKPIAVIARTNLGLFNQLVKLLEHQNPPNFALLGGLKSYYFEDLLDLYYLSIGKRENQNKWKKFKSLESLEIFADRCSDKELMTKIKIFKSYSKDPRRIPLPDMIQNLKNHVRKESSKNEYVFTTVHKAKGQEWKTVILCNDFCSNYQQENIENIEKEDIEEKNLLYVAATRAKSTLVLNDISKHILNKSDEKNYN